jgi:hypothetical protein
MMTYKEETLLPVRGTYVLFALACVLALILALILV